MFTRLDPTIHKYILPVLKPLSLAMSEEVYRRGQDSSNLCFLVKGEVLQLSPTDDASVEISLTKEKTTIYERDGSILREVHEHEPASPQGCFGHTVLQGIRRRTTCRTSTMSELLTIDKEDLLKLFEEDSVNAIRLCNIVRNAYRRIDALVSFVVHMRIALMDTESQAVAMFQQAFRQYIARKATKYDPLYMKILQENMDEPRQSVVRRNSTFGQNILRKNSALGWNSSVALLTPGLPAQLGDANGGTGSVAGGSNTLDASELQGDAITGASARRLEAKLDKLEAQVTNQFKELRALFLADKAQA